MRPDPGEEQQTRDGQERERGRSAKQPPRKKERQKQLWLEQKRRCVCVVEGLWMSLKQQQQQQWQQWQESLKQQLQH